MFPLPAMAQPPYHYPYPHTYHYFFGLVIFVLNIIAIVSILMGTSPPSRKLIWILVIILFPVIGVILYFLIGRSRADL